MASSVDLAGVNCAPHGAPITVSASGKYAKCGMGCDEKTLLPYAQSLNGHLPKKDGDANEPEPERGHTASPGDGIEAGSGRAQKRSAPDGGSEAHTVKGRDHQQNGRIHLNGQVRRPTLEQWRAVVFHTAETLLRNPEGEYQQKAVPAPMMLEPLMRDLKDGLGILRVQGHIEPQELTATDVEEECERLARMALEEWAGGINLDKALPAKIEPDKLIIPWEGFDAAVAANEEYLKREPVVDKLCYSHAVSMVTGGKHAGKSTLARWMAICVVKGWPFLKRACRQGPVMYIASEDETMAARQELLRLGWDRNDPFFFLSATNAPNDDQARFMGQLTQDIIDKGVKLVVIDMLFDFVNIQDEIKYAETRRAVGVIQTLASLSGTHVVVIHHAPKYADSAAEAGVTALGSQGLAARVSPIILVRRHGPEVHSVSSTAVRDPRGEAIDEAKLLKNADGSVTLGGGWKMWMQAEVFAPRVLELLQTEPGQELTAGDVKDALGISYQLASGSLAKLYKEHVIGRSGEGRKGKPFRYSADPLNISMTNGKSPEINSSRVEPMSNSVEEFPDRLPYKD